ncbi:hypothetical protein ACO0KZ_08835 [Undibacterium sp. Di24W]
MAMLTCRTSGCLGTSDSDYSIHEINWLGYADIAQSAVVVRTLFEQLH